MDQKRENEKNKGRTNAKLQKQINISNNTLGYAYITMLLDQNEILVQTNSCLITHALSTVFHMQTWLYSIEMCGTQLYFKATPSHRRSNCRAKDTVELYI